MAVKNRLAELLSIKAREEDRGRISNREVAEVLGLSPITVNRYVNNEITRFDSDTLERLCYYLGCTVGELLFITEEDESLSEEKPAFLEMA